MKHLVALLTVAVLVIGTGWLTTALQARDREQAEDEIKAALVLNFARFTEWPSADRGRALEIGILGRPDFAAIVQRTTAGKDADGRPLAVRALTPQDSCKGADVVFVGGRSSKRLSETLSKCGAKGVLTIGETHDFTQAGGGVSLFEENGRFSFEVNLAAVNDAGLNISAKLLRLGRVMRRKDHK